jgi:hypothetical protein
MTVAMQVLPLLALASRGGMIGLQPTQAHQEDDLDLSLKDIRSAENKSVHTTGNAVRFKITEQIPQRQGKNEDIRHHR